MKHASARYDTPYDAVQIDMMKSFGYDRIQSRPVD